MRILLVCIVALCFLSCKKELVKNSRDFSKVEINVLLQDSLLNVRALEIDSKGDFGFASSNGEIGGKVEGWFTDGNLKEGAQKSFQLKHDSLIPNFRSIAITKNAGFALSIATPALLYKIDGDSIKLVFKENHPKVFYDSMEFWNDDEGIAVGDAIDGCLSIIITRDGGNTWKKLSCDQQPPAIEREGAFAASDTNIAIVGNKTWIGTTAGRIFYSDDKGETWDVIDTPIVKEKDTEGIYSLDFYDEWNGFAIGGDYTKPADSSANKMRTQDGGKTWQLVAENKSPGYRSCVQYIPNGEGNELVAIGFKGIDYSPDAGNTWKHLSDEGFYTIRFLNDSIAYAAGAGRIAKLTFRE